MIEEIIKNIINSILIIINKFNIILIIDKLYNFYWEINENKNEDWNKDWNKENSSKIFN